MVWWFGGLETRFRLDPGSGSFGDEVRGGVWFSALHVAQGGVLKYLSYRIGSSSMSCTSLFSPGVSSSCFVHGPIVLV